MCGILTGLTIAVPLLSFPLGILALACSGYGEISSHGWYLDGKGQIPARIGLALGAIPLAVVFFKNLKLLTT